MKFKILAAGLLFGFVFSSCHDEMTYKENTAYEKDYIEAHYKNVVGLISDVYLMLDYDHGQEYGGAMLASATGE
ncbi:MAG: RagB/SusD family nutrient uptake outer membrane protein, partial [Alistipes sp.]|nr:RagB/SusD family nutrient uptake outer membrane protein [Alistipes sp.]